MFVNFYTLSGPQKKLAGRLEWDGRSFQLSPPDSPLLRNGLSEPVGDVENKRLLDARDDPERFLHCLADQYRSPYLYATDVQQEATP